MSGLPIISEQSGSDAPRIKDPLQLSREAYERVIQQINPEETKTPDLEYDDFQDQNQEMCIQWLTQRGLTYTKVAGNAVTCFINAMLQQVTGNYTQEKFEETAIIQETLNPNLAIPDRVQQDCSAVLEIIQAINRIMQTNILVCILTLNRISDSKIIAEVGSKFGDPAVIWNRKQGLYSSIILSDVLENEFGTQPESPESNSFASITQNYCKELQSFKRHLYDIANPLITQDILETLSNIQSIEDSFTISNDFSSLILPKETYEVLKSFSDEISKLLTTYPDELQELKVKIIQDLNELSKDVELEDSPWEELKLLFDIPDIRALPNIDVKKIKHHIYKGNTESLRDCLDSLLKIRNIDVQEINNRIAETDFIDLETLLAEIVDNRPRKKEDLLNYWHMKEDFFINKTFYLNHSDTDESISGFIVDCTKTLGGNFTFKLHDNTEIKISKCQNTYSISIRTETSQPFWSAFKDEKLNHKEFEIRMQRNFKDYNNSMIYPGKYRVEKQDKETSLMSCKVKELVYLRQSNSWMRYCIKAVYPDIRSTYPSFEIALHTRNNNVEDIQQLQFMEFQKTYLAVVTNEKYLSCDPSKHIIIRDEIDENQLKLKYLEEIYTDIESIRLEFSKEECRQLLESLLDNLIENQLTKLELDILNSSGREDLFKRLNRISTSYKNNIKIERYPDDILKQIVIDANYTRTIHKSQGLEVSKAMELLKQAFKYVDEIRGNDVILFIGNTGSGKSTAISYLLGADMEYFYNKAGEQVVKIKEDSTASASYPIIGQSLGESETLYTRGYHLPSQYNLPSSVLVTDCPGFSDTRGGHFELCTNLSIDQTIKQAANIKGIVIAVPIQAFQLDRSNPIINLIEAIVERFRDTFNADNPEGSKRVFILITKSSQVPQGVMEKLKDGSRFQELYSEISARVKSLHENGRSDKFELDVAERKKKLWQILVRMHEAKQIDVIDIKNKIQRKKLLEKYSTSTLSIDKSTYEGLMQSRDMQIKFGKYIEMSTHTWTHLIFKQYLEVLPSYIKASLEKMQKNNQRKLELSHAKQLRESRIQELLDKSQKLNEQIEKSNSDIGQLNLPEGNSVELMNQMRSELQDLEKEIQETDHKIIIKATEISELESQLSDIVQKIEYNQTAIQRLSSGSRSEILYEEDYRGKEKEIIKIYKQENTTVQTAFEEIRELADNGELSNENKASSISGALTRVKVFEKIYKLVPTDPDLRREFEKFFRAVSGDARYIANIDGEGISDIQCKANGDGKKIAYHFNLNFTCSWYHWLFWLNPRMPWIRITHEIPNIDYNEAAIINNNAIINQLLKYKADIEIQINGIDGRYSKSAQKQQLEQKLVQLINKREDCIKELDLLKSNLDFQYLKKRLNEINSERDSLISSTEIEDEVESIIKDNENEQEKINSTTKRKKYLAIIIRNQIDTARLIRDFAEIVISGEIQSQGMEISSMETTDETLKSCSEFIREFDSNIAKIEVEVTQDLLL